MGYLQAKMASFQQSFPHFPQGSKWIDKSGEKWWKMGIEKGSGDMDWGGYKNWNMGRALKPILRDLDTNKYKTGGQYLMEQYKREGT